MIALDSTFLLDYLDGVDAAAAYLTANEEKPFFAPSLALFEVYRGAARIGGPDHLERVASGLDWVEPLPLTDSTVREAARIEATLLEAGDRINLGDTLITGICRHTGARIVTRASRFDRVPDLAVVSY